VGSGSKRTLKPEIKKAPLQPPVSYSTSFSGWRSPFACGEGPWEVRAESPSPGGAKAGAERRAGRQGPGWECGIEERKPTLLPLREKQKKRTDARKLLHRPKNPSRGGDFFFFIFSWGTRDEKKNEKRERGSVLAGFLAHFGDVAGAFPNEVTR
jgi:hypothetical protein